MQAEVGHEALVVKAKEGDADAIAEWLASLERDPNSQALLLGPKQSRPSQQSESFEQPPPVPLHGSS
jgi:hypothetical protein